MSIKAVPTCHVIDDLNQLTNQYDVSRTQLKWYSWVLTCSSFTLVFLFHLLFCL